MASPVSSSIPPARNRSRPPNGARRDGKGSLDPTRRIYDEIAEDYARHIQKFTITRRFRRAFLKHAGKGGAILDLGCGPGLDCGYFAKHSSVVGVDFSGEMLRLARRRFRSIPFLRRDMRRLRPGRASLNGVWISQSLHHIAKREARALLGTLGRALKRGGAVFISVREGRFEGYTDRSATTLFSGRRRFLALYEADELRELLTSLGFAVVALVKVERFSGEVYLNVLGVLDEEREGHATTVRRHERSPGADHEPNGQRSRSRSGVRR